MNINLALIARKAVNKMNDSDDLLSLRTKLLELGIYLANECNNNSGQTVCEDAAERLELLCVANKCLNLEKELHAKECPNCTWNGKTLVFKQGKLK